MGSENCDRWFYFKLRKKFYRELLNILHGLHIVLSLSSHQLTQYHFKYKYTTFYGKFGKILKHGKDRYFPLVFKEFRTTIRTRGEQQSRLTGYPSRFSSSCLTVYIYCLSSPHLSSKWNTEETYLVFTDMNNWKTPVQMK